VDRQSGESFTATAYRKEAKASELVGITNEHIDMGRPIGIRDQVYSGACIARYSEASKQLFVYDNVRSQLMCFTVPELKLCGRAMTNTSRLHLIELSNCGKRLIGIGVENDGTHRVSLWEIKPNPSL